MKINYGASRVAGTAMVALALLLFAPLAALGQSPQVRVEATTDATGTRIEAKASGPFEYTTYRPSETLFVVDLAGVTSAVPAGARVLKSDAVSSYRVLQYRSGEMAIVRVEMLMRTPSEPRVERVGNDRLVISFEGGNATVVPATARRPVVHSSARVATWIEDVKVENRDERTSVTVLANGKLSYEALRLNNPERLVLDFGGTKVRAQQKSFGAEHAPVSAIRMGQFKPAISRVVIDLDRGLPYRVNEGANTVTVTFGDTVAAAPAPSKADAPVRVSAAAPLKGRKSAAQKTEIPAPSFSTLPALALTLPEHLTNPAFAMARPLPPAASDPIPAPSSSTPAGAAAPAAVAPAQGKKYEGEPISVNFKDVDLKDFFRLIHEISGLNVVVDPNVKGTLTIVLEEVPWDQALDIALKNNNLDKQVDGNVLRIATRTTLKKEAEERRDLIKAEAEAIPAETRTYTLSYAKATGMRDTLKRFLSPRGEIIADERSNTLIVRDIPSVFPQIEDLRSQLDRKTQQVEIEARVVAATRTFARDVGTQFGFATSSTGGRSIFGGVVGSGAMVSPIIHPGPPLQPVLVASGGAGQIPLMSNLGATAPTSGASFIHSSPNFALDFILTAAESKGVGKLLSKPKIFTQNNKKGTVMQGTKIPLQTSVNNTITVTYIDAVLKLEVTPQITAEGTIFLEINVENTDIDEGVPRILGIPALTTQKAETNILVSDGGTVVLGGVMVTSQRTDVQQVPLLGSIPILGHLFKKTAVASDSQELLFFVTPRIIPN